MAHTPAGERGSAHRADDDGSKHGEDRSFQECLYHFRAEGIPRPEVCRAFSKLPANAAPPDGGSGCNELSPSGWSRVECRAFGLPAELACFSCVSDRPETSRQIVQAFSAACDRGIVVKGCNVDIRKVTAHQ